VSIRGAPFVSIRGPFLLAQRSHPFTLGGVINRAFAKAIRVTIAVIGGIVFAWLCSCEAVFGGANLMNFINGWFMPGQQESDLIYRGKLGDVYVQFAWVGLIAAAGVSFALFTLEPIGKRKLAVAGYAFLLILLLPLSVANYISIDFSTERLRQAIFDIVLVLLGLAAIQRLVTYHAVSILGRITRSITVFLLAGCAVIIPGIYAVIWFLNAGDIAKAAAKVHGFRPSWISGVAAAVAAALAILAYQYKREPGPQQS
jgi:hypothetical protein